MGWVRIADSAGYYAIDAYYEVTVNTKENYSDIKVSGIRFIQNSPWYYFYNNYPPSSPLSATLGLMINGSRWTQRVQMGQVTGTREYWIGGWTARVPHNPNGEMNFYLGAYSDTQTPHGNLNWGSRLVNLPIIDRSAASISTDYIGRGNKSLTYRIKTNKDLSDIQYSVNWQSWTSIGSGLSANNSLTYSIGNLSQNTSYNIRWRGITSINGIPTYESQHSNTTDADGPSTAVGSISSITVNSAYLSISSTPSVNNPVTGYSYSLNNSSWTGWQTSGGFSLSGLASNTYYVIYVRSRSENGKISPTGTVGFTTDSYYPTLNSIEVLKNTYNSISVRAIGVSADAGLSSYKYYLNNSLISTNSNSSYVFTSLSPKTSYTVGIEVVDRKGRTNRKNISVQTKPVLPQTFSLTIGSIKNSSFHVSIPSFEANVVKIRYYLNNSPFDINNYSYTFSGLNNFTDYNVKVIVYDDDNNSSTSEIKKIKTLPALPSVQQTVLTNIKPKKVTFNPVLVNKPGVNISKCYYSLDSSEPSILATTLPFTIENLKPNTSYTLKIKLVDKDGQYDYAFAYFKTLQDRWMQISINGASFVKGEVTLIYPDGKKIKIEKSKRKIII